MSRESVACVTRTFTCDSLRRNSSWLEIGSLVMSFKICPCRNRFCAFSPMVLKVYSLLHNYAYGSRCLSIHFFDFPQIFPFEQFPLRALAGIFPEAGNKSICRQVEPRRSAVLFS